MKGKRREFLRKVAREALRRLRPARSHGGPVVPPLVVDTSRRDGASTVFFLCPDYDVASGGIRTLYRHVDLLNAAGVSAAILHTREGFRCTWFPHDTRIAYAARVTLKASDVLVLPEVYGASMRSLPQGIRQVIFNQNTYLTFSRATLESWEERSPYQNNPDLRAVLVVSEDNAEYLRFAFPRLRVERVHQGLDPTVFHPPTQPAGRRIALMTRRYAHDTVQVVQMLRARGSLAGWELVIIENRTPQQTADLMRQSAIFLAPSHQEGFGLPPVEAMACGSLAVGFPGHGGREFLRPEWSMPAEQGNVTALAQALEQAIRLHTEDPAAFQALARKGTDFVRREYAPERERADVVGFFQSLLSQDAREARP
ncbi:glycosyltransferase family 4 protein [Hyalangium rubrum]|uniref:Glycosyltransferase family 4 protein n=1 Tax=Hyalangium rubrum TaxID=3103134 RepID=A0ABU5HEG6_9BACT|nr:glycosyltransferase family 4 protein [Hyalangium sp. s54d21]MDY7231843.1 glycosyltransferase family 4 protein [Hyalangium sp. s54d21]